MRILSLSPAAAEWACAFGAEGELVGTELDRLDPERLRALRPDVVLVDAASGEGGPAAAELGRVLAGGEGPPPAVVTFAPATLKQVLNEALRLARALGRLDAAMPVLARAEAELRALRARLGARRDGTLAGGAAPTVACLEEIDPLGTAGLWVPDVVEMAGGRPVLARSGEAPSAVSPAELRAADPEWIVLALRGGSREDARRALGRMAAHPGRSSLAAVRAGRLLPLDGADLHRPGPALYRTIRRLAETLHPDRLAPGPPGEARPGAV